MKLYNCPGRRVIILVLLGFAILILFTFRVNRVSGESMSPTLQDGQLIISVHPLFGTYEPCNNEIVVAKVPGRRLYMVKRIMGIPGDTIEIYKNGLVEVNGEPYEYGFGSFLKTSEMPLQMGECAERFLIKLSEDEFFLVGDNFEFSTDSRHFGPISVESIRKVVSLGDTF